MAGDETIGRNATHETEADETAAARAVPYREDQKDTVFTKVDGALDRVTATAPGERKYAREAGAEGPHPSDAALQREQQIESQHATAGPGLPVITSGQSKGLIGGALIGGLIGAVLIGLVGLIHWSNSFGTGGRVAICAIVGALAGGTAGAVYGGGRMPELEGETIDVDGQPSVGTTLRDPRTDARGRGGDHHPAR